MDPLISLITLARDNPEELAKTVRSVALQTVKPDTYVVLDSSSRTLAPRMKDIAESAGATYVWTAPEGIYPAMRMSIDLIPSDSYSWWINSSDWLAGRDSVKLARQAVTNYEPRPVWVVGQLIRLHKQSWSYHDSNIDGESLLSRMKTGRSGFPHPSTIFWTPSLKEVKPYDDGLSIASDYSTALRFGQKFGPPLVVPDVLSLHVPQGISVQKPFRNVFEKSKARLGANVGFQRMAEPGFLLGNIIRGTLHLVEGSPGNRNGVLRSPDPLGGNRHFCDGNLESGWPQCCNGRLEDSGPAQGEG